jgi:integral membrane protein
MSSDTGSTTGDGVTGTDRIRLAAALTRYRALANVVGVLLIVLCLVGLPLNEAHLVDPAWFPVGSDAQQVGDAISKYLGVAHGWLYMLFLLLAFALSRRARWTPAFTVVTLLCGTVPILSFWAEHRATQRVRAQLDGAAEV